MRLKAKFRPNLPAPTARSRKVSGSENPLSAAAAAAAAQKRIRTVSGSSTASLKETVDGALPPAPATPKADTPITTSENATGISMPGSGATPTPAPPSTILSSPPRSAAPMSPPPPVPASPILKSALLTSKSPERTRHPSANRASLDSAQSLSPNFLHSPPRPAAIAVRQRRLTETSTSGRGVVELMGSSQVTTTAASVYDRRKADHKRKFNAGVPERKKMTMFDLIYYNPSEGARMSNSSSRRASRASSISEEGVNAANAAAVPDRLAAVKERLEEEMVDDDLNKEDAVEDEVDEKMPVPQVKVGPNGEIVVDEESTVIETSAAKKAKEDLLKAPVVFESSNQSSTNYGSWGKKRKNVDWTNRETMRFYKALSVFGTDFSMMESVFKRRSRHDLKMKFKREERSNRGLVDRHLRECMPFDTSIFDSEGETDEDEEEENAAGGGRRRRRAVRQPSSSAKKRKRRSRKSAGSGGYYSDSDDADADAELSEAGAAGEAEEEDVCSGRPRRRSSRRLSSTSEFPTAAAMQRSVDALAAAAVAAAATEHEGGDDTVSTTTTKPTAGAKKRRLAAVPNMAASQNKNKENESMLKNLLQDGGAEASSSSTASGPIVALPPGLLAANPGLANAVPGSLVVVASPSTANPPSAPSSAAAPSGTDKQVLHVFKVTGSANKS